jgi:hypothetical protein
MGALVRTFVPFDSHIVEIIPEISGVPYSSNMTLHSSLIFLLISMMTYTYGTPTESCLRSFLTLSKRENIVE